MALPALVALTAYLRLLGKGETKYAWCAVGIAMTVFFLTQFVEHLWKDAGAGKALLRGLGDTPAGGVFVGVFFLGYAAADWLNTKLWGSSGPSAES